MTLEGEEFVAVLTFENGRGSGELICAKSGLSWMQEYVFSTVGDVFSAED